MQQKNENYNRSKPEVQASVGYNRFEIGFVFAEYDLFKPTTFIYIKIFVYF